MTKPGMFTIQLSGAFIILSIALSTFIAFSVGWISRLVLLTSAGINPIRSDSTAVALREGVPPPQSSHSSVIAGYIDDGSNRGMSRKYAKQLPAPKILAGKQVPLTTYTSKSFPNEGTSTSNTLHIDRTVQLYINTQSKKEFDGGTDYRSDTKKSTGDDKKGWVPLNTDSPSCDSCSRGKEKMVDSEGKECSAASAADASSVINDGGGHNDDSDGLHLPAGQHLLVDIKDVDSEFLNSEERLASAMIELTNESKLTLLSYHCHSLVPIGVSCAGVLLESHVAFHTWPLEGVITLDLFTCGGGKLVPLMPLIQRLFSVKQIPSEGENEEDIPEPTMLWAHKLRGFREGFAPGYVRTSNPLDEGLGWSVLGRLDFDMKRPLLSTKTEFQHVDIYEVMDPDSRDLESYQKSLSISDNSYESMHPELFGPNKILFLDGVQQSTLYGDAPYHESIVHPAMLTHANPQRVAIIGGGEGATLRETLKHTTVDKVVMIEIDKGVVELSREYLKEWSDCSDIVGSTNDCFDDPRAEVRHEDAMKYFISGFRTDNDNAVNGIEKFDVIVMDALDPNDAIDFSMELYTNHNYIQSLYDGLTDSGILAIQLGESAYHYSPADEVGTFKNRAIIMKKLEEVGFKSMHVYTEVWVQ